MSKDATRSAYALSVRCPYCAAGVGEFCRTASGHPITAQNNHSDRWGEIRWRNRNYSYEVIYEGRHYIATLPIGSSGVGLAYDMETGEEDNRCVRAGETTFVRWLDELPITPPERTNHA